MKIALMVVVAMLVSVSFSPVAGANSDQRFRADADEYYAEQNYRKAYKLYYKMATTGDHYSQDRVAQMYANGEGKKTDLIEAYAWSVLAAESGDEAMTSRSEELLERASDQEKAKKRAKSLVKKYGQQALAAKAERNAKRYRKKPNSDCTGSRLGCRGN